MRRRLYWLMPDLPGARQTMNDLLLARVEHRHMHFMAREGTDLSDLHEANLLQASDLVRSAQVGMVIGAALGAAAGAMLAVSSFAEGLSKPGLVGALELIVILPLRGPVVLGEKTRFSTQVLPAAMVIGAPVSGAPPALEPNPQ